MPASALYPTRTDLPVHLCGAFATAMLLSLAGCGGGGDAGGVDQAEAALTTAQAANVKARATPAPTAEPVSAPFLRLVVVNPKHANASDSGSGSSLQPYRSIAAAMRNLRPGDDVVIAAGVYRESVVVPSLAWGAAQTRLRAATPRTVLIKGSAEIYGWSLLAPGIYNVTWTGEEPQQVFRNGRLLKQVGGTVFGGYPSSPPAELAAAHASEGGIWPGRNPGGLASLVDDSFTFDATNARLVVRLAQPLASDEALEVSTRRHVLQAEAAKALTVEGLDFAHANTSTAYRQGAVKVAGEHNILRNLVVRDMDAACVQVLGNDNALFNTSIDRCGQLGLMGRGTRLTVSGNFISHANTRGFNKWWEAGGIKLIGPGGLHNSVLRDNVVTHNEGDGIWIDWKNSGNRIENNTVAYNSGFGIHYEASRTGTISGNRVYGNGQRGIYLMESSESTVQGNAVFANALEGIAVLNGTRSDGDSELLPVNNRVSGNAVAWNDNRRNWVQLVLPGLHFGSSSDRNAFRTEVLRPRMSVGFVSPTNPAFESLDSWRGAVQQDVGSTEQTTAMSTELGAALQARRILADSELPEFLVNPGVR